MNSLMSELIVGKKHELPFLRPKCTLIEASIHAHVALVRSGNINRPRTKDHVGMLFETWQLPFICHMYGALVRQCCFLSSHSFTIVYLDNYAESTDTIMRCTLRLNLRTTVTATLHYMQYLLHLVHCCIWCPNGIINNQPKTYSPLQQSVRNVKT